jgi:TAT-translocated FGD2 family F420-dependent dehydrogenase
MAAIGFALSHEQFPAPELVELGIAAEQAGFDCLWTSDHFQPWMDNQGHAGQGWLTLAALGQRTSIPMGTGVTCPTYRYHPAVVAQAFATLDQLYPKRIFLGTGTGEALNEKSASGAWGPWQERGARLEEAIGLIRELWSGEIVDHRGPYFTVAAAKLYDAPRNSIPIYVSAMGPKAAELAGRVGDGLVSDAERAVKPEILEPWQHGLESAGRDRGSQQVLAELMVVVGDEADVREAAETWRFLPKAWSDYVNDPDPRVILERARTEIGIEEPMAKFVAGTDAQPHVERLTGLFRNGVTQVYVHSGQADQRHVIDFYGREVIPAVKREIESAA